MSKRVLLAKFKAIYGRGSSYLSILNNIILLVIALKVFYEPISSLGVPMYLFYLLAPVCLILLSLVVGFIDLKYGVWKDENDTAWEYTPIAKDHINKTNEIYTEFKKRSMDK